MRVRNLILALLFFVPVTLLASVDTDANKNDINAAQVISNDSADTMNADLNLDNGATDEWRGRGWGRGFGRGWGGWGGWGLGNWWGGSWGWPSYGYSWWPYSSWWSGWGW